MTATQRAAQGARRNADSLSVGVPVVIMWAAQTYLGTDVPAEVAIAIGGILGSIGAKIVNALT
ncbi:hypothetical protein [uncultured Halomonas sp.]|uniref:hypothetical protein n=1 Tax=uncultured Halomonas sp. TaxID=173971 RepID=UPI00261A044D|nr:hypothetical protein [uncultured Halomonas sp.]